MNIYIPGVDVEKAIKNSGSEELFLELLADVYKLMDGKINLVESYLSQEDLTNYTVEVHSLKTTCRMIGAMELGEEFFALEQLGKDNNLEQIKKLTPDVLNSFKALKPCLEPFAINDETVKHSFDKEAVSSLLNKLIAAINDFDLATAENATKQLFAYDWDDSLLRDLEKLSKLVSNLDYDEAKEQALKILGTL